MVKHWKRGSILCSIFPVPVLIKDTNLMAYTVAQCYSLMKPKLISEPKAENIFVGRQLPMPCYLLFVRRFSITVLVHLIS